MSHSASVKDLSAVRASQGATLQIEPLTGTLGAEVSGIDLSQPISPERIGELNAAVVEHKVIFFRDQDITPKQQVTFARAFGALEIHPFTEKWGNFNNDSDEQNIVAVESTPETPFSADMWHSDVTWRPDPAMGSILRGVIIPPVGGDTLFADMTAAYDGLDDATRSHLSGLVAVHDWWLFRDGLRARGVPEEKIAELNAKHPPSEHPVVRTHPVSGKKIIYVDGFTVRIKGMSGEESRALLTRLSKLAHVPEYQVRFRWRKNSIAFWDNRSTQHYAVPDFYPQHRLMHRVTVAGDVPF